jgi:hypothetical protein
VFRAPFGAGAAHIVRLGPILIWLIGYCDVPRIRYCRTPPRSHEGENVRHFRQLSTHGNASTPNPACPS